MSYVTLTTWVDTSVNTLVGSFVGVLKRGGNKQGAWTFVGTLVSCGCFCGRFEVLWALSWSLSRGCITRFACSVLVLYQGSRKHGNEKTWQCLGQRSGELSGPFCLETLHFHVRWPSNCPELFARTFAWTLPLPCFFCPSLYGPETEHVQIGHVTCALFVTTIELPWALSWESSLGPCGAFDTGNLNLCRHFPGHFRRCQQKHCRQTSSWATPQLAYSNAGHPWWWWWGRAIGN